MDLIRNAIRDVPDFPKPGILFKDITPILHQPHVYRATINELKTRYQDAHIDVVAAIESRGFLFGSTLAYELDMGLALIRKPGKLPCDVVEERYDLEYGSNILQLHTDAITQGQRVLIIDDLLATGGTARAAANLVRRLGGVVVEHAFVVELGFLGGRERLAPDPVHALVSY